MKQALKFFLGVLCCGAAVALPLLYGLTFWPVMAACAFFLAAIPLMQTNDK